jgi:hypothetical protein
MPLFGNIRLSLDQDLIAFNSIDDSMGRIGIELYPTILVVRQIYGDTIDAFLFLFLGACSVQLLSQPCVWHMLRRAITIVAGLF